MASSSSSSSPPPAIWTSRVRKELSGVSSWSLPPFLTLHDTTTNLSSGDCILIFKIAAQESASKSDSTSDGITPSTTPPPVALFLSCDMSSHGDDSQSNYPFSPPNLLLLGGAENLPSPITVYNNDKLHTTLQWTPSLAVTDAVLDVAVRLKESIRSGEAYDNSPPPAATQLPATTPPPRKSSLINFARRTRQATPPSPQLNCPATTLFKVGDMLDLPSLQAPCFPCSVISKPGFLERKEGEESLEKHPVATGGGFFSRAFSTVTSSTQSLMSETFLGVGNTQILEIRASKFSLNVGVVVTVAEVKELAKLKFRRGESISFTFKQDPSHPLEFACHDAADVVTAVQGVMSARGVKGRHTNAAQTRLVEDAMTIVTTIQVKENALESSPTVELVTEIMDLYRQAAEKFAMADDERHQSVMGHMQKFLNWPMVLKILDGTYVAKVAAEGFDEDDEEEEEEEVGGSPLLCGGVGELLQSDADAEVVQPPAPTPAPIGEVLEQSFADESDDDDGMNDDIAANTSITMGEMGESPAKNPGDGGVRRQSDGFMNVLNEVEEVEKEIEGFDFEKDLEGWMKGGGEEEGGGEENEDMEKWVQENEAKLATLI